MRLGLLGLLFAGLASAQSGIPSFALNSVGRGVDFQVRINAPVVRDAPFAAEERSSAAGVTKVYRDGAGRTRLERALTPSLVEIHDPEGGVFVVLDEARRVAHRVTYTRPPAPGPAPLEALNPLGAVGAFVSAPVVEGPKAEDRTEALGTRLFEGVEATGQRDSLTYPANSMGNSEPLVATQESWYAASIHATVLAIQRHPQTGEIRTELVNIKVGEPEGALFRVPEGYEVVEDQALLFRVTW